MNTTGGATIMGSYPYPPNGLIEIDYEFILIFKKPGNGNSVTKEIKTESILSKEEWKKYFTGHWNFGGTKQIEHEAMFPDELPFRLIKMFTFVGDTVLDPFLGSGTTVKVASQLKRNCVGYEINENFVDIIKKKLVNESLFNESKLEIVKRESGLKIEDIDYTPKIKDAKPNIDPVKFNFRNGSLYKVVEITGPDAIKLNTGLLVKFLGTKIVEEENALKYLKENLLRKEVIIKFDKCNKSTTEPVEAYVYLKNKIFINSYLIKSGLAVAEKIKDYDQKEKFLKLEKKELCQKNGF